MKIAVVNGHYENYAPLAKLTTYGNRVEYCRRHGYILRVKTDGWTMPACHPVTWDRFKFLRDVIADGEFDWVWCSGTDSFHTNMTIKLESFLDTDAHVVISSDWCSAVQADSYFVRRSNEALAWCDEVLAQYPRLKSHPWVEQEAMIEMLPHWKHAIKILPQRAINSYDYRLYRTMYPGAEKVEKGLDFYGNDGQWQPGDFLIHWPSQPLWRRLELVKEYEQKVVR